MAIEKDEVFRLAERYIQETGVSVFLTGKAGTGKTTFLKHICETTGKRFVVLAPTGVAAINAGGSTIHSFFQLPLCPYLPDVKELVTEYQMPEKYRSLRKDRIKILRTLDLLIIDEISMVRADLLDAVDSTLRRYRRDERPFGGLQFLMIGDAQQLSPVVKDNERQYLEQVYPSPYFFASKALQRLSYITIELQKVHRQKDAAFLEILNGIRENRISMDLLDRLNSRVVEYKAEPGEKEEPIRLTTHNSQAEEINTSKLNALRGKAINFAAEIEGDFPESSYPAEEVVSLKKGAQVMFIRNDAEGQYYNGKIGRVEEIGANGTVIVSDAEGRLIDVEQAEWTNTQYALDADTGEIKMNVVGTFRQIPLKTAWAITIHKSQGLTFNKVIIDAGAAFAFGQVYVALSRCRTLDGITLTTPVRVSAIYSDTEVSRFNRSMDREESIRGRIDAEERKYRFDKMRDAFTFDDMAKAAAWLARIWKEHLFKIYPTPGEELGKRLEELGGISATARRFKDQLNYIQATNAPESYLEERMRKAAEYFKPALDSLFSFFTELSLLEIDNKEVKKKANEAAEELLAQCDIACQCMGMILGKGFSVAEYNRIRTSCLTQDRSIRVRRRKLRKVEDENGKTSSSVDERLRDALLEWRSDRFKKDNVPAYTIMHQSTLLAIASKKPRNKYELLMIKGFGETSYAKYGTEILEIIERMAGVDDTEEKNKH